MALPTFRRCFLCKSAFSQTQPVEDADLLDMLKTVDTSFKSGNPLCLLCISQARQQIVERQSANTSKSTRNTSITNAFQSQTQSQPLPNASHRSDTSDQSLELSSSSQPIVDLLRQRIMRPMPRSKKAARLAAMRKEAMNISGSSGAMSETTDAIVTLLSELEADEAEEALLADLPKRRRVEKQQHPINDQLIHFSDDVSEVDVVDRPVSRASSTDHYDRMINTQPLYIPTPVAERPDPKLTGKSPDKSLRPTPRRSSTIGAAQPSVSTHPTSMSMPPPPPSPLAGPSGIGQPPTSNVNVALRRISSDSISSEIGPSASAIPSVRPTATTLRDYFSATITTTTSRLPPPSPIAGPSGMQTKHVQLSRIVNFDSSNSDIDPLDIVPPNLRQKPSQVPRIRNVTPPNRASSSTVVTPIDINNFSRTNGG